ncbi:hypothetical protein ACFLYT_00180 [Nanoarchaeota archaeon]
MEGIHIKNIKLILAGLISIFIVAFSIVAFADNTIIEPVLAEFVNGKSVESDPYIDTYRSYFDLDEINYKNVDPSNEPFLDFVKVGNFDPIIEGYEINYQQYAIHLLYCNKQTANCIFRVNGLLIPDIGLENGIDEFY